MQHEKSVCVLYGGVSVEHEVSRVSAATVVRALRTLNLPLKLIAIAKDGGWFLQSTVAGDDGRLPVVCNEEARVDVMPGRGLKMGGGEALDISVVFPILHGAFGEDGSLQALLEHCALPYVGSGKRASSIGMHKLLSKLCWREHGLPIVEYCSITIDNRPRITDELRGFVERYNYPLFIKPCNGGSSIGVSKAHNESELLSAIERAAKYDRNLLCERAISGREIEFAVFDTALDETMVSVAGEIVTEQGFYDYESKYTHTDRATLIAPAKLGGQLQADMQQAALDAYKAIGCRDFARIDLLLEADGHYYINEINTMPGFTAKSMFPILCELSGHSLNELLVVMLERATKRATKRHDPAERATEHHDPAEREEG